MNERWFKLSSLTLACLIVSAELEHYALPSHAEMGHDGGDTVPREIARTMVSTLSSSTGSIMAKGEAPDGQGYLTKFNPDSFRSIF